MHYFVTGASGFIGKAVLKELLSHNHTVTGLVRSDAAASTIRALGATPLLGTLTDLPVLTQGAANSDGVIHLAFVHDFSNFESGCATDRAAITALAEGLAGTGKPLIITIGTGGLPPGSLVTEEAEEDRDTHFGLRAKSSDLLFELSDEKGFRGSTVRLAPTVHGPGDWAFIPQIGEAARKNGAMPYIEGSEAHWPAIHRDDSAVLYRLAVEKAAVKAKYHGTVEFAIPVRQFQEAIAKKLRLPMKQATPQELMEGLGAFLGGLLLVNNQVSSEGTQKALGWKPVQIGLVENIEKNYFNEA